MRFASKLLATVLAALALTIAGAAQAQTTLRYKYKQGDKIEYVINQDQQMAMSLAGMDIDIKVGMVMDMTWETVEVDQGGNAKVKMTLNYVKMVMDGPTGKVEVDSKDANESDDPVAKTLGQIVKSLGGMETTFTADSTGDMKDLKISEETAKKLKEVPGIDALGEMFSADSLKSMVSGNMVLPKDPVKNGHSWTQEVKMKLPFGKVTGKTKYTYEGTIDKNGKTLDKIGIIPEFKIEANPDTGIEIKVKESKGKGYTLFDNANGRVIESTNEMTMQMELEIQGMTINQNVTQTTTMRLKGKGNSNSGSSDKK
jgi:hypothetical protein